jgi:uncharacterized tellurite resistance protein B-like protein
MRQVFVSQINNLQSFSQMQKEAAIDLLLLVMYADGIIDPNEIEYIDQLLLDSTWASDKAIEDYLSGMRETIIETLADTKKLQGFVEKAKIRIGDAHKVYDIYTICAKMANVDQNLDPKELEILKMLMSVLE